MGLSTLMLVLALLLLLFICYLAYLKKKNEQAAFCVTGDRLKCLFGEQPAGKSVQHYDLCPRKLALDNTSVEPKRLINCLRESHGPCALQSRDINASSEDRSASIFPVRSRGTTQSKLSIGPADKSGLLPVRKITFQSFKDAVPTMDRSRYNGVCQLPENCSQHIRLPGDTPVYYNAVDLNTGTFNLSIRADQDSSIIREHFCFADAASCCLAADTASKAEPPLRDPCETLTNFVFNNNNNKGTASRPMATPRDVSTKCTEKIEFPDPVHAVRRISYSVQSHA